MRKPRTPKLLDDQIPSARPRKMLRPIREEQVFHHRRFPALYPEDAPVTEERLINAMKILAYVMSSRTDGEVLSPIFERLERELEKMRRRKAPVDRARKFLEAHTIDASVTVDHKP